MSKEGLVFERVDADIALASEALYCCTYAMAEERPRSESVTALIRRLRFVSSSAPAIYLNERLAEEMFRAQLGAIESFARTASRSAEGSAGPAIVRVGASKETSEQVTYDLGDPLTKALLLHSALGGATALGATLDSAPGTFIEVVGTAYLPPVAAADPLPPQDLRTTVAAECTRQTQVVRALGDEDTVLMPLLLTDQRGIVGSVIVRRWIRQEWAASYLPLQQVCFGIVERVVQGLPLFTLIYMRPFT